MLSAFELFEGIVILIWVVVSILIGLRILLKSRKEEKGYTSISLFWILSSSPYFPMLINFFLGIPSDVRLPLAIHLALNILVIWWGNFFWFDQFTKFFLEEKRKIILVVLGLAIIIYETIVIIQLIIDPVLVGSVTGAYSVELTVLHIIANMVGIISLISTGLYFAYQIYKAKEKSSKFRGISLALAFVIFFFGVGLDAGFIAPKSVLTIILSKILLLIMGILFYLGFFPPKKLKE